MNIYGIEILADNISECRSNVLKQFSSFVGVSKADVIYKAASYVVLSNIVHGDTLTALTHANCPITFSEWEYIGKGKFSRRDFLFASPDMSLQPKPTQGERAAPVRTYPPLSVRDLATASLASNMNEALA